MVELCFIFDVVVRDLEVGDIIFVFDVLDECDFVDFKIFVDIMNDVFLKVLFEFKVKCLMISWLYE